MKYLEIEYFYPYPIKKRYGGIVPEHKGLDWILRKNLKDYISIFNRFLEYKKDFLQISYEKQNEVLPFWNNGFFPLLDTIALFGFVADMKPKRYLEIGSGNSTKITSVSRKNYSPRTQIISIDPHPRSEIDALCDRVIRKPLQDCDLSIIDELEAGDILFFDGSHRVLQNSDTQVFFFEILPRLKENVLIHIHDISWPHDYPDEWSKRYYSEQYVLGAMILFSEKLFQVLLPNAYISMHTDIVDLYSELWQRNGFEKIERHGCSFWLTKINSTEAMRET